MTTSACLIVEYAHHSQFYLDARKKDYLIPLTEASQSSRSAPAIIDKGVTSEPADTEEAVLAARVQRNCMAGWPRPAHLHHTSSICLQLLQMLPLSPHGLRAGRSWWPQDGPLKRVCDNQASGRSNNMLQRCKDVLPVPARSRSRAGSTTFATPAQ
jgi:hypothetical protein